MDPEHADITTTLENLHQTAVHLDVNSSNGKNNRSITIDNLSDQEDFVDDLVSDIVDEDPSIDTSNGSDANNNNNNNNLTKGKRAGDDKTSSSTKKTEMIKSKSTLDLTQSRSVIELLKSDNNHHLKIFLFGAIISVIAMLPFYIIFVYFEAHYCDGRRNHRENGNDKTRYVFNSTNHILIVSYGIYINFVVSLAVSWFLPSILCLYQSHWNRIRILSFLYGWITTALFTYFLYQWAHNSGAYLIICWSVFVSLFVIIGIFYGYPAFRALLPFVCVFTLIVLTFSIVYMLLFKRMRDDIFSLIYPWYLCLMETLALYIIDGFLGMCNFVMCVFFSNLKKIKI